MSPPTQLSDSMPVPSVCLRLTRLLGFREKFLPRSNLKLPATPAATLGAAPFWPRAPADHHRDTGEIESPLLADVDFIGQAIAGDVDEKIDVLGSILAFFAGVRDDDEAEIERQGAACCRRKRRSSIRPVLDLFCVDEALSIGFADNLNTADLESKVAETSSALW